jgi:hypothetical protein
VNQPACLVEIRRVKNVRRNHPIVLEGLCHAVHLDRQPLVAYSGRANTHVQISATTQAVIAGRRMDPLTGTPGLLEMPMHSGKQFASAGCEASPA